MPISPPAEELYPDPQTRLDNISVVPEFMKPDFQAHHNSKNPVKFNESGEAECPDSI